MERAEEKDFRLVNVLGQEVLIVVMEDLAVSDLGSKTKDNLAIFTHLCPTLTRINWPFMKEVAELVESIMCTWEAQVVA